MCVPDLNVGEDDASRLHSTDVTQVFTFILQALPTPPPQQSLNNTAERLITWVMEFEDVLSKIPSTVIKDQEHASLYCPIAGMALPARYFGLDYVVCRPASSLVYYIRTMPNRHLFRCRKIG
jgi:hypothetical protein